MVQPRGRLNQSTTKSPGWEKRQLHQPRLFWVGCEEPIPTALLPKEPGPPSLRSANLPFLGNAVGIGIFTWDLRVQHKIENRVVHIRVLIATHQIQRSRNRQHLTVIKSSKRTLRRPSGRTHYLINRSLAFTSQTRGSRTT